MIMRQWRFLFGIILLVGACHREPDPKSGGIRLVYLLEAEAEAPADVLPQARDIVKRRLAALKVDANISVVGTKVYVDLPGATPTTLESVQHELSLGKLEIRELEDGPALQNAAPKPGDMTAKMADGREIVVHPKAGGIGPGNVEDASVQKNDSGVSVDVRFNAVGAAMLERMTRDNINRPIAIILDGKVLSMPIVKTPITEGRAQITMGSGDLEKQKADAEALVRALEAGALHGRLVLESTYIVPPLH